MLYLLFAHTILWTSIPAIFNTNLPKSVVYEDAEEFQDIVSGGLKTAFTLQNKNFGIISNNKSGCNYLSIIELGNNKILLEGSALFNQKGLRIEADSIYYDYLEKKIIKSINAKVTST